MKFLNYLLETLKQNGYVIHDDVIKKKNVIEKAIKRIKSKSLFLNNHLIAFHGKADRGNIAQYSSYPSIVTKGLPYIKLTSKANETTIIHEMVVYRKYTR